uniref:hypothetical protein n=1 Tax=Enterococcus innesii TaxID=2839759 RepID=UPI003F8316A0
LAFLSVVAIALKKKIDLLLKEQVDIFYVGNEIAHKNCRKNMIKERHDTYYEKMRLAFSAELIVAEKFVWELPRLLFI